MFDTLKEECGVFGIYSRKVDTSKLTMYGLFAIQHRGQESAGIATSDGYVMNFYKNTGLVSKVFKDEENLKKTKRTYFCRSCKIFYYWWYRSYKCTTTCNEA